MDICPDAVLDAAVERLRPLCGEACDVGLILGSGLGAYAARLEPIGAVPYEEIPGFPVCGVAGRPLCRRAACRKNRAGNAGPFSLL